MHNNRDKYSIKYTAVNIIQQMVYALVSGNEAINDPSNNEGFPTL